MAVQAAGDWHVRSEIVRSMVAELLGADLSLHGGDYQDMSRRVSAYENYFECVVHTCGRFFGDVAARLDMV